MKTTTNAITIPTILEVGKGTLDRIGALIAGAGYDNLTVFFGAGMYPIVGERVTTALKQANLNILHQYEQDDTQIDCLMNFAFSIPASTELIVGIGGGRVLDVAKYVGFLNDIPYISVPTSTSNDGFASSSCSLFINGRRRSVSAKMPLGIIVDINVIKNAPEIFIHSGIGDLVSKITAVYDWEFEARQGKAVINDFAVMIAKKSVNSVVRMDIKAASWTRNIRDEFFLEELVDSLTLSGIAMEIAGNSAPASGSEHLISHGLDTLAPKPQLHGIQVGVATYLMSLVQDHRQQRIRNFLTETGFFKQAQSLHMKAADFEKAIDLAPSIKPHRHTYLHIEENRALAKQLLRKDEILKEILE